MVTMKDIQRVNRRIVEEFHPQRVVLFGSHARGTAGEDSDVDLLVVLPFKGKAAEESARIRLHLRTTFPVDILARTPSMVRRRLAMGDPFMREVLEKGSVLYEESAERHGDFQIAPALAASPL